MKKVIIFLIFSILLFIPIKIKAEEKVRLYLFYSETCPHCKSEEALLEDLKEKYKYLEVYTYEVSDSKTTELLSKVFDKLEYTTSSVPFTVIGSVHYTGYNTNVGYKIEDTIRYYSTFHHKDVVGEILGIVEPFVGEENPKETISETVKIPILGEVNPKEISLPIVAVILGFIDGFNPCAMWVLIFLITVLIGNKDRKKMWILGLTFLITSALIYSVFMFTWLDIALKMSEIRGLQLVIAVIALIAGAININSFFKAKEDGCNVVEDKKRKKILVKIKKFVAEKSFLLSILGIIGLALTVNLIELACSAGLPLLFTQILALNDLSRAMYILNIILYVLFFMIDDIIIFTIAMMTFKVTGISSKYTKYSHLIGGIIMLVIAVLMIFAPNILMFNF